MSDTILHTPPGVSDYGWMNPSAWGGRGPSTFAAAKMTPEAKKRWSEFLSTYEKPSSFELFYANAGSVSVAYNRGPERYARFVENRSLSAVPVNLSLIMFNPPGTPAQTPKDMPVNELPLIGRGGVAGIVNAVLNRASIIGGAYAGALRGGAATFDTLTTGDIAAAVDIAKDTAKQYVDALFGDGVAMPGNPAAPPPPGFLLWTVTGQVIQDGTAADGLTNEIYDPGGGGDTGGGGGGGGLPDPSSYLDTANRIAKLLQSALDLAKPLLDRVNFLKNLADALDVVGKTLGIIDKLGDIIRDAISDENGDQLLGDDLEAAIDLITPMVSEIIAAMVSEIFKGVKDIKKTDSSDKGTKKDKLEIDADSLRDVFNDYFLSSQDFNVADTLSAMSSIPSLGSYEIEY